MKNNNIFIPIYFNKNMSNNLFTIALEEFRDIKSITSSKEVTVNVKSPLSEISYDLFGKCIQGDIDIKVSDNCSKQEIRESMSVDIQILMKLKNILIKHNYLNIIKNPIDLTTIKENDFIVIQSNLVQNPIIKYFEELIKYMEFENIFNYSNPKEKSSSENMINTLKSFMINYKKNKCDKYITNELYRTNIKGIIPIENKYMIENIDHILNKNIKIAGKVSNVIKSGEPCWRNIVSNTCFDCILDSKFQKILYRYNEIDRLKVIYNNIFNLNNNVNFIEIIPILIYI